MAKMPEVKTAPPSQPAPAPIPPDPTVLPPAPHGDQKSSQPAPAVGKADQSTQTQQLPTIGRIVQYCLSYQDAVEINAARNKAFADVRSKTSDKSVRPARVGNVVKEGDIVVMMIVAVWSDSCVNGQLILDGNDSHWVTSRNLSGVYNTGAGTWAWPAR
jgi:hypothetical protein